MFAYLNTNAEEWKYIIAFISASSDHCKSVDQSVCMWVCVWRGVKG